MKKLIIVLFNCILICGLSIADNGVPPKVQKHIDALLIYASSNNWDGVRTEYPKINWGKVDDPAPILKKISKSLNKNKNIKDIRKLVKTQYRLFTDNINGIDDPIEEVSVPVAELTVIEFIEYQKFVKNLQIIEFIEYQKFVKNLQIWGERYDKQYDFLHTFDNQPAPMKGSVLWGERERIKKAILNDEDYEQALINYNIRIKNAQDRHNKLK